LTWIKSRLPVRSGASSTVSKTTNSSNSHEGSTADDAQESASVVNANSESLTAISVKPSITSSASSIISFHKQKPATNATVDTEQGVNQKQDNASDSDEAADDGDTAESSALLSNWFKNSSVLSGASSTKDPILHCLGLSRKQRVLVFVCLLLLGSLFLSLSFVFLPMLLLKARKFAILYSMGSFCLILSFSALWGPVAHFKHLVSGPRITFSAAYFSSLIGTLYCAIGLHSALAALVCCACQIGCLVWYLVSYIPGGVKGLQFFAKMFYSTSVRAVKSCAPA
ncbi:hypothetical protein BOX15_Mlig022203g1, partial [Macrostomum lignano]